MRRTLTVVLATAALLAPAGAAFAEKPVGAKSHTNASCSNGKGGNGGTYNENGNTARASQMCGQTVVQEPSPKPTPTPTKPADPPPGEVSDN